MACCSSLGNGSLSQMCDLDNRNNINLGVALAIVVEEVTEKEDDKAKCYQ